MPGQAISAYVHFPYCLQKCPYCDFASGAILRQEVPHERYAEAVLSELRARSEGLRDATLASVFFGGGTPSLWSPDAIGRVLAGIRESFGEVAPELEVTVECNPTSLDADTATALRGVGVGRLSIGVQSLDEARLRFLGRLHSPEGALRALEAVLPVMPRVSGDLMFGMPDQTPEAFLSELDTLLSLGLSHVSVYALTIEPDTQFGQLHRKGRLKLAPSDTFADTFLATRARMAKAGLSHYEVSNYARPGQTSVHNCHYWRGGAYLGIGAGAVGMLPTAAGGARRYRNEPRPEAYMEAMGVREVFEEALEARDRVNEALMLGLRTDAGLDCGALLARTGVDVRRTRAAAIEAQCARGNLEHTEAGLRVPPGRWLHLDGIVAELFE